MKFKELINQLENMKSIIKEDNLYIIYSQTLDLLYDSQFPFYADVLNNMFIKGIDVRDFFYELERDSVKDDDLFLWDSKNCVMKITSEKFLKVINVIVRNIKANETIIG